MTKQNTPIYISLLQECKEKKPEWYSTTAFVNEMLARGLATLDRYDTLKLSTDKERENKKKGDNLSNSNRVSNRINKEKEISKKTRFKFSKDLIPFELQSLADLISDFWKAKKGKKTEAAFNLLMSEKGLLGIKKEYGENSAKDQLTLAIANEWQSITKQNYETFAKKKNPSWNPEPVTGHPSQKVFKASDLAWDYSPAPKRELAYPNDANNDTKGSKRI